ncbi:MAG: hypothetical protein ACK5EU_09480 [Pseudanabaena sp.]|jgi:hypothetical protein|uniref:hypothetical protein n=1 Tax=Pseudanabaena mucicola TaxID=71190 RepID=UPI0025764735|nr:hypothetical protein [Pseudanabaena mucicola]MCA6573007.1 hypothetical protein [Pseudanabaena sp. M53BS1SP1A06MG]MCA6582250.1 hypothetical protein [Pseudanabaena sp. M34BS1SP1A06MG]MCA6585241.1 hypothetical protein [Pseudanabaena sp. M051S1SP1A06QC]MCA6591186.1 hypothetical protein [Pseudanabaena sp. M38BS1SP1A06MG]MCA6597322.1 hypothetical protein [Pseudanabaena sp. M046S1SP1A06QC]MCA6598652.1 hypothetical protein [Pseudanabaena sp. M57BS1SP1A06MG]MCA6603399.1 hypothetical protein [Pseud
MDTQLIKLEIDMHNHYTVSTLYQAIQDELNRHGKPLNWIVSGVDKDSQKVYVKAIFVTAELNWRECLN